MSRVAVLSIIALGLGAVGTACEAAGGGGSATPSAGTAGAPGSARAGEGCRSSDPDHLCLGVHYVSYKDGSGAPVVSEDAAIRNIQAVDDVWKQCNIGFQIDRYEAVNPADKGLAYGAESANQLDPIRAAYGDGSTLLVVYTGPWGTAKNAWTAMPGSGQYYGAIVEASVADFTPVITHELGHYLNLDHIAESPNDVESNVMNWRVFPDSNQLNPDQCAIARAAAKDFWKAMLRY